MPTGYVYIMSNRPNGTLYVGVTSNLSRRCGEHKSGQFPGFTRQYGLDRLVYWETFGDIRDAIQREKAVKRWRRAWKTRLIMQSNPNWADLSVDILS